MKIITIKKENREYNIDCINDYYYLENNESDYSNDEIAIELEVRIKEEYYKSRNDEYGVNTEYLFVNII